MFLFYLKHSRRGPTSINKNMSPSEDRHLLAISVVADDLSSGDRKKAIYLCGSLVADSSVDLVRETLRYKVDNDGDPRVFIMSVLWQLGRYDILRKLYKVGRNDIEQQIHIYGQVLPRFRVLMVTISDDLAMTDVEQIKFLLSKTLTREKIENSKTFLDVVIELEKLDSVSPERVEIVEECLHHIGRLDLVKKVTAYKMSVQTPGRHLIQQQSSIAEATSHVQPWDTAVSSERGPPPRLSYRAAATEQKYTQHFASVKMSLPVCREPSSRVQLEQYNFTANPRGVCVIFDCVGKDGEMLSKVFEALHFKVLLYSMLGADEIFAALKDISKHRENHRGDAFVCCIISRSMANNFLGTSVRGSSLSMDSVRHLLLPDSCPMLAGKPKLFFIQSYDIPEFDHLGRRECQVGYLETDGCHSPPMYNYIPKEADIFWSQCWTDERQLQQKQHHSVYLKALADGLSKSQRWKMGLLDVHTEVNGAIYDHNKRNPEANYRCEVKHTLRKNLYL
ncbi:CASP8 and FADD-like apoptosis regulator isoform X2 [Girardinichthys multiradiatus]|uniref:CASP8 and FADD-like apoptosis regulator isoform X2 n=1 Tax=Girardinichthys multiradiatus TaxID=208333 RepID=UPI001FADE0A2|nr:CASP8 and FADD-like apoptosis regulator isoform X2 [Girardinichthys multiradiatus]